MKIVMLWMSGVLISISAVQAEVTAVELQGALQRSIDQLNNTHVVFATRNMASWNGPRPEVYHYDLWIQKETVQAKQKGVTPAGERWWEGHEGVALPYSAENLSGIDGYLICGRGDEEICRSEFTVMPFGKNTQYPSYLSLSRKKLPVGHPIPLIEVGRTWNAFPEGHAPPVVNWVSQIPVDRWRILGSERLGNRETVKVELARHEPVEMELKRHAGKLSVTQTFHCWFSREEGNLPVRIEDSMRYGYEGKEYSLERSGEAKPFYVYEASEAKSLLDGLIYPVAGMQETYGPAPASNGVNTGFDTDGIVDRLLADGAYRVEEGCSLMTRDEWRVLKMERISPDAELWVEAPKWSCVHDRDLNQMHIAGVSTWESRRRLGLDPITDLMNLITGKLAGKPTPAPTHRPDPNGLSGWIQGVLVSAGVLVLSVIVTVLYRRRTRRRSVVATAMMSGSRT